MNKLECIQRILEEHLQEDLRCKQCENYSKFFEPEFSRRVYDSVFNWIIDKEEFPKSVIRLDTYLNGLEGFSTNRNFQSVVAFTCLEGLTKRRHNVLNGEWEKVTLIIVKNCSTRCFRISNKDIEIKKDWILKFCSPKLCPNPFLRLEFFRLMNCFQICNDQEPFRASFISTICELHDNHSRLTVDQVPRCSAKDLEYVIKNNSVEIRNILNEDHPDSKRTKIIMSIVKITKMFALLEIERFNIYISLPNQTRRDCPNWNPKFLRFELLYSYLSFCGLWLPFHVSGSRAIKSSIYDLTEFIKIVSNNWIIRECVLDRLRDITNVSLGLNKTTYVDNISGIHNMITEEQNNMLLHFVKAEQRLLPQHLHHRKLHGITPPGVHWLRDWFQIINSDMDTNGNSVEISEEESDEVIDEDSDEEASDEDSNEVID
ncbi:unnamed protein product [Meganyctiphanes norvegica]|uniref:Uncharacterized protein n=1 Tax=Meganyctiphanes norvegica TaxID=48144 RepID=A0AAV2RBR6_MEGNR